MEATIVKIGNSQGLIIPKKILARLGAIKKVDMQVKDGSLLIVPLNEEKSRQNWERQFADAIKDGYKTENDLFDNIVNDFDKTDWTW
jgi:antitoxin MazE